MKPRDIVIVQDSNPIRSKWRVAQVTKVEHGRDGKVREVQLRYKLCKHGADYKGVRDKTMCRSVHRLVVLFPVEQL